MRILIHPALISLLVVLPLAAAPRVLPPGALPDDVRLVPLKDLKSNRLLRRMRFLARPRQSIAPLTEHEYNEILRLAGLPPLPFH